MTEPYLSRAEAAEYLRTNHGMRCKPTLLRYLACVGGGPIFSKASRFAIYTRQDLDTWAATKVSRRISRSSELHEQETGRDIAA